MRGDDRAADSEAHAEPARLRRVEGLEHARRVDGREARPRVADRDDDVRRVAGFVAPGAQPQHAARGCDDDHRVHRVHHEVQHDLLELDAVAGTIRMLESAVR